MRLVMDRPQVYYSKEGNHMTRKNTIVLLSLLVFFLLIQMPVFAAPAAQGNICGHVYSPDMKTPLEKGSIRLVNADTGEAKTLDLREDGCYCAKGLTIGNYSMSYSDGTTEYLLPDKLLVQNKVVLATCVSLGKDNSLSLMQTCKVCREGFPLAGWIAIGAGGATGATVAIKKGGGEEAVASQSNP